MARRKKKKGYQQYWVNTYLVDRGYGGPEEGGWWFTFGDLVESIHIGHMSYHKAQKIRDQIFEEKWKPMNEGRYPISSVLSEGEFETFVEEHVGQDWPSETPHYE